MASSEEDIEDMTTCSVCLLEYDDDRRQPKYLFCFHTVCLSCLEQLCKEGSIRCPLCRARTPCTEVAWLRNNPHAYHMVNLKKKLDSKRQRIWCLTCAKLAEFECICNHETVDIPRKESSGGQRLQATVNKYKATLAESIEKRRKLQSDIQDTLDHLKWLESIIRDQEEENDIGLAQLMSALDTADKKSHPEESYRLMKSRVVKSTARNCKELSELSSKLENFEREVNALSKINLETLQEAKADTKNRREFSFFSNLIFSLLAILFVVNIFF